MIRSATLTLPPTLQGSGCLSVSADGLTLTPGLRVARGPLSLSSGLDFSVFNVIVHVDAAHLTDAGLRVDAAQAAWPDILGSATDVAVSDMAIAETGAVTGRLGPSTLTLDDLSVHETGATIGTDGIAISLDNDDAHFPTTIQSGAIRIPGDFSATGLLFYDGTTLSGGMRAALPPIEMDAFTVAPDPASFTFWIEHDHGSATIQYHLHAGATVTALGRTDVAATVDIGSVNNTRPFPLYAASIDVQFLQGIPIPDTPLQIAGLGGKLDVRRGANDSIVATLALSGEISTDFVKGLLTGNAQVAVASDGNIGMKGGVSFLGLASTETGICVIAIVEPHGDAVCKDSLVGHTNLEAASGVYVESAIDVTSYGGHARLKGDGFGQLWLGSAPTTVHFAGAGYLTAHLDTGIFDAGWPSCTADAALSEVSIGTFERRHDSTMVPGVKATANAHITCLVHFSWTGGLFYDINAGKFYTSGLASYQLREAPHASRPGTITPLQSRTLSAATARTITAMPTFGSVERTFRVAAGQKDAFFTLLWARGAPTLQLIAPDGAVVSPTHLSTGQYLVARTSNQQGVPVGYRGGVALYLTKPQPGLWHVRISNLHGNEGFRFASTGTLPPPQMTVLAPSHARTLVARVGHPVTLAGTVTDAAAGDTISVFYTRTRTVRHAGKVIANYAGVHIADAAVRKGRWSARWDPSALPKGHYYVYAILNNGTGPLAEAYGAGSVLVTRTATPGAPRAVRGIDAHGRLTLKWAPPINASAVAGYIVRWRTTHMRRGQWYRLDVGRATTFTFIEPMHGVRYAAEISSYGVTRQESKAVAARITTKPAKQARRGGKQHRSTGLTPAQHDVFGAATDSRLPRLLLAAHARSTSLRFMHRVFAGQRHRAGPRNIAIRLAATLDESCSGFVNRLAGTRFANLAWPEPGTGKMLLVGTLDAELPHTDDQRTNQVFYGPLDYVFDGPKEDVLLTLSTREGRASVGKYYRNGHVGRATGIIAVLTSDKVKPTSTPADRFLCISTRQATSLMTRIRLIRGTRTKPSIEAIYWPTCSTATTAKRAISWPNMRTVITMYKANSMRSR